MLNRTKASGGRALVLAFLALVAVAPDRSGAAEQYPSRAAGCELPDTTLESSGARIGEILVDNMNIFDLEDPEEDKALFRLMNRLHVRTRESVIRRQLLFQSGDPFNHQRLEETERILRQTNYLYDAEISILSCEDGVVDVLVRTRDVWTLQPSISLERSGGETRFGFDLQEENFLGRGGSLWFFRRIDEDRTSTEVGYADRNLGPHWISLSTRIADNSDGHAFGLSVERPFYSLDTRRAGGGQVLDEKREDTVYSLGDEIGKFRHDIDYFDLYAGWSDGLVDRWVTRWMVGAVHDRRRFGESADTLDPPLIPEDRQLVYPYIEYQLLEDHYGRAENLDQIQRTEDVLLGAQLSLRLGVLAEALGADREGAVFAARWSQGYGDPSLVHWVLSAHADGRIESGDLANAVAGVSARWYLRQSDRRLLFATLRGDVSEALDLDNPLEIGGDNGLRGYPLRYQRGDARAQFTIEQRYFTDYYLWRLFRVGGAVFFDAGRVWGENPYGGENFGWLRDVGFGLRLASTRSSIGKMIHIDFAFPLDGDASIDSFQILFEGKRSF